MNIVNKSFMKAFIYSTNRDFFQVPTVHSELYLLTEAEWRIYASVT